MWSNRLGSCFTYQRGSATCRDASAAQYITIPLARGDCRELIVCEPNSFNFTAALGKASCEAFTVLADAFRVTLGPKSKYVLIKKKFDQPIVCEDGVTIVKEVELKNPEENLGAPMVRDAAGFTGLCRINRSSVSVSNSTKLFDFFRSLATATCCDNPPVTS